MTINQHPHDTPAHPGHTTPRPNAGVILGATEDGVISEGGMEAARLLAELDEAGDLDTLLAELSSPETVDALLAELTPPEATP